MLLKFLPWSSLFLLKSKIFYFFLMVQRWAAFPTWHGVLSKRFLFFNFLNSYCSSQPRLTFCNGGEGHSSSLALFSVFYSCQHFAEADWVLSTAISGSPWSKAGRHRSLKENGLTTSLKWENDSNKKAWGKSRKLSLSGFLANSPPADSNVLFLTSKSKW